MSKRNPISVETKIKILEDVDSGMKQTEIVKKYNLPQPTVSNIVRKRKRIENSSFGQGPNRKRMRAATFEEIDEATFKWFCEQRAVNIPINGPIICARALKFAKMMNKESFKASNGWLENFQKRYGIVFKSVCGEEKSAPLNDAQSWREKEMKMILEKFLPENIYNADEAGLFYQLMPDKTMALKNESCKGGKKSKQRITVLFCANLTGSHKLKPLVIGRSLKPRCFKNVKSLPGKYNFTFIYKFLIKH